MKNKNITTTFKCLIAAGFLILGVLLTLSLVSGCQSMELLPSEKVALEAAVKTGTLNFIQGDGNSTETVIATIKSSYEALEFSDVGFVKIGQIVESTVDFGELSNEHSLILGQLFGQIGRQVEAEGIDSKKTVKLSKVLIWIYEAALLEKGSMQSKNAYRCVFFFRMA